MKHTHAKPAVNGACEATPGPSRHLFASWLRFWFTPVDPIGLHGLRVLAGLLFLAWLLPFAGDLGSLFGLNGWFDQQAYEETGRLVQGVPAPASWSMLYLCGGNPALLTAVYWLSIAVLVLFTLGLCPRITAVLTWLIVASFMANPAIEYEGDALLALLAFYLLVGHVLVRKKPGQSWLAWLFDSSDSWLFRRRSADTANEALPSVGANLALRLLQVHLAIVVVASGLHKLQFGDWWAGLAFWYPLYPPFEATLAQARAHAGEAQGFLFVLSLAAYAVLAWQLTFPLFAWRPACRLLLLGGAGLGWLGLAFVYHLPLLGPILVIGCLSYLSPGEWHWWAARLGRPQVSNALPAQPAKPGKLDGSSPGTESLVDMGQHA